MVLSLIVKSQQQIRIELVTRPGTHVADEINLTWAAPADDGGYPITGYVASFTTTVTLPLDVTNLGSFSRPDSFDLSKMFVGFLFGQSLNQVWGGFLEDCMTWYLVKRLNYFFRKGMTVFAKNTFATWGFLQVFSRKIKYLTTLSQK